MRIEISELRRIANLLLDHVQSLGADTIEVEHDYYWEIHAKELYDPYRDPSDLGMGQLTEDWKELTRISTGEAPPVGAALTWLGTVLRAVGEKVVG
jgi:hypothetical protein